MGGHLSSLFTIIIFLITTHALASHGYNTSNVLKSSIFAADKNNIKAQPSKGCAFCVL